MARRKRSLLTGAGLLHPGHRVVSLDALTEGGPDSLEQVWREHLEPDVGTAVLTEGLLPYLDPRAVEGLWRRIAALRGQQPVGLYLSELHRPSSFADVLGLPPGGADLIRVAECRTTPR